MWPSVRNKIEKKILSLNPKLRRRGWHMLDYGKHTPNVIFSNAKNNNRRWDWYEERKLWGITEVTQFNGNCGVVELSNFDGASGDNELAALLVQQALHSAKNQGYSIAFISTSREENPLWWHNGVQRYLRKYQVFTAPNARNKHRIRGYMVPLTYQAKKGM